MSQCFPTELEALEIIRNTVIAIDGVSNITVNRTVENSTGLSYTAIFKIRSKIDNIPLILELMKLNLLDDRLSFGGSDMHIHNELQDTDYLFVNAKIQPNLGG